MEECPEMRLLIVYPYIPLYRVGIFRALVGVPQLSVVIAADAVSPNGIATVDPSTLSDHRRLRNHQRGNVLWQSGLLRILIAERYDAAVFLADAAYLSTWLAAIVARLRKMRVYFWTIGWHKPDSGIKRLVRIWFYRLSDCLWLYGNVGKQIGLEAGFPPAKMTIIGNSLSTLRSVDFDAEPEISDCSMFDDGVLVLGAVLRVIHAKRLDLLIEAASVLQGRSVRVGVMIVGDGPELAGLVDLAGSLDVDLRCVRAVYSEANLGNVYMHLDITVVPGAIGLTAVQSLMHGTPVVTHSNPWAQGPEWESVVPGVTGELFTEGNVEGLADAIERVLANLNRDRREVEKACRREAAEKWSVERQLELVMRALND